MKKTLLIFCLMLWGCATTDIPTKVFTTPANYITEQSDNLRKITIASTSNFQDSFAPIQEEYSSETKGVRARVESGGAELLSSYLNILKNNNKSNLILVDAGGIFKENSSPQDQQKTIKIFRHLNYDAIAFSDSESQLLRNAQPSPELPFLASNSVDLATGKNINKLGVKSFLIKKINNVKIAIASVNFYKKGKEKNTNKIYYEDPILSFLKVKRRLRRKKIEFVILLVHTYGDVDKFASFVKRLPPNSVDLIVTDAMENGPKTMRSIPILHAPGKGQFLSHIELYYNKDTRQVAPNLTQYYGKTKTCRFFFASTLDCHIENNEAYEEKLELVQDNEFKTSDAVFLNHPIKRDQVIKDINKL